MIFPLCTWDEPDMKTWDESVVAASVSFFNGDDKVILIDICDMCTGFDMYRWRLNLIPPYSRHFHFKLKARFWIASTCDST